MPRDAPIRYDDESRQYALLRKRVRNRMNPGDECFWCAKDGGVDEYRTFAGLNDEVEDPKTFLRIVLETTADLSTDLPTLLSSDPLDDRRYVSFQKACTPLARC